MSKNSKRLTMARQLYTHTVKKTGMKCFFVPTWPGQPLSSEEKAHPLCHLENGQVTRINIKNLDRIKVAA